MKQLLELIFPRKCILCRRILSKDEMDLCRDCRTDTEEHPKGKLKLQFIDSWAAVWYYKGYVRHCLLRYKFHRARNLAQPLGRLLAMKLISTEEPEVDVVTWVPISRLRRFVRGYDQDELLAKAVAAELNLPCRPLLTKIRHNRTQSGIRGYAKRRANVLGVYRCAAPEQTVNQRILLVDDILTTGATLSECARVLLTAGAKEIHCAVVASAHHKYS